jgi:hypothetical protein
VINESKHFALAVVCGAKRGPKDSDLTFSPASLRDFLKAVVGPVQEHVGTAKELFAYEVIEKLDVRPSTKIYLDNPPHVNPTASTFWQPIKTAPKAGNICVAHEFSPGRWVLSQARFNPETEEWADEFNDRVLYPTHWTHSPSTTTA